MRRLVWALTGCTNMCHFFGNLMSWLIFSCTLRFYPGILHMLSYPGPFGKVRPIRESNHGWVYVRSIMRSTMYRKSPFCSPEMWVQPCQNRFFWLSENKWSLFFSIKIFFFTTFIVECCNRLFAAIKRVIVLACFLWLQRHVIKVHEK